MEFYTARAMRMFNLSEAETAMIHSKEIILGRCLTNAEIQNYFKLGSIKDDLNIVFKDDEMHAHRSRIQSDLESMDKNIFQVHECNVERTHKFDKEVQSKKDQIRFYSEMSQGKKKRSNTLERIKSMEYLND